MDTVPLVENQLEGGRVLLDRLAQEGVIVRAACWVKPVDEDRWSLYIATPSLDEKGPLGAYAQIIKLLGDLRYDWTTSSNDVSLVSAKHPLVEDALDLLRRFPHRAPIRSPRSLLGGIPVEEVYVYPLEKKEFTIYGLFFKGDPSGALGLFFEKPTMPSWLQSEGKRYEATVVEWTVTASQGGRLERDKRGENGPRLGFSW
jgi:hypothetical protein